MGSRTNTAQGSDYSAFRGKPPRSADMSRAGSRVGSSARSTAFGRLEQTTGSTQLQGSKQGSARSVVGSPMSFQQPTNTKRLSSLDLMRMKIDAQMQDCPKDERKTREYLHRTKAACGLILSRRVIGRPLDDSQDASLEDSDSWSSRSHVAANEKFEDGNCSSLPPSQLPKLSAKASSAPPSPHQQRKGSPRRPEEVRKVRPTWEGAHSLARDKAALTARARMEGDVKVDFKIPYGVTWSPDMSTKPREWCDFILDRPKRVWNWGQKLEKIHDEATEQSINDCSHDMAHDTSELLGDLTEEAFTPLKTVFGSLSTRADILASQHAKTLAIKTERTLMRLFSLCIAHKVSSICIGKESSDSEIERKERDREKDQRQGKRCKICLHICAGHKLWSGGKSSRISLQAAASRIIMGRRSRRYRDRDRATACAGRFNRDAILCTASDAPECAK